MSEARDDREAGASTEPGSPRYEAEQNLLLEFTQALTTTLDLERLNQIIAEGTARLLGVETTAVYLLEGGRIDLGATMPPLDPTMPEALRWAEREVHPHIDRSGGSGGPGPAGGG